MIRPQFPMLPIMLCVAVLGGVLSGCPSGQDVPQPLDEDDVVLTREHPAMFSSGSTIAITIEIDIKDGVEISAIALVETVPTGWAYVSAESSDNGLPGIRPEEGAEDVLSFVWIQPPVFPYTFTYTLEVPLNVTGIATLSGHVEYRQGSGPSEFTDTLTPTLAAS